MKKLFKASLLGLLALGLVSCDKDGDDFKSDNQQEINLPVLRVATDGVSSVEVNNLCPVFVTTDPLTADEIEFLYAVREDEKLARDLVLSFAKKYPTVRSLSNIGLAEATHISGVENLLNFYEIEYPALTEQGEFSDILRQTDYDTLLAQGETLLGAYSATAAWEEESIVAYTTVLPNIKNENIKLLITNLLKSSTNHFKVYIRQIPLLGGSYTPSIMDEKSYNDIVNTIFDKGNKYGKQNQTGSNTNSGMGQAQGGQGHHGGNQEEGCKGTVNNNGSCTSSVNGGTNSGNSGKGQAGKGYRGGK